MQRKKLRFGEGFHVSLGNERSQGAEMTLAAGDSEGGPDNRHRGADQWLYVVTGTGIAIVAGKRCPLQAGVLLLIEKGEAHEIRNTGRGPLRTMNVYVPPAYDAEGNELPRGKR